MRVQPHRLGIYSDGRAEGNPVGQIAMMQLVAHAGDARRSHGNQPPPIAGLFSNPMAGILARPSDRCNRDRPRSLDARGAKNLHTR
jgi:hypothetical protein